MGTARRPAHRYTDDLHIVADVEGVIFGRLRCIVRPSSLGGCSWKICCTNLRVVERCDDEGSAGEMSSISQDVGIVVVRDCAVTAE